MKNRWLLGLVVLVVLTQFTGCGGGGGGPTDPSTAPVLSGIAVRPNPANAGANMILEIQYVDVNADLNDGIAYITDSQGYSYTGQVSNAPGTSGTLVTTFALHPLVKPGQLLFNIFVQDRSGNSSNTVYVTITVS